MCDRTVWKRFAQYITYDYVIAEGNQNSGKHLSLDVLVSTLRKLIHKAKAQHETKSVANRQFFTCVDQYSSSDDAKWLSGLVHNMRRKSWERSLANGDPIDQSVTPLDEQVFVEVCAALLEEGSPESMHRRLALVAAWMNAGRASETSWLALESLEWDNSFRQTFAEVPQTKSCKMKVVAFVAGRGELCFNTAFGDSLATRLRRARSGRATRRKR